MHWCSRIWFIDSPTPHLRAETNSVSETLCSLEYRTMDDVQKPSNPESYPSCWLLVIITKKCSCFYR
jgi:hypothetical protein